MDRRNSVWLGSVEVDPLKPVVVSTYGTWTITYTVGRYGVDNGGRLRLVWKSGRAWGTPQWDDPEKPNYVSVTTTGKARFDLSFDAKGYYRPWRRALTMEVQDSFLREGDRVTIVLGDTSQGSPGFMSQPFYQRDFYFRLLAECFETNVFEEIPHQPVIPVVAAPASRLVALVPSEVPPGEPFSLILKAEDQWGNPATSYSGRVQVGILGGSGETAREYRFSPPHDGYITINDFQLDVEGIYSLTARDEKGMVREAKIPLVCKEKGPYKLYWGDLHAQTNSTAGRGTDTEYFDYAKNVSGLDVSSIQGNDFQLSPESWESLKEAVESFYEPGRFVTFLGYEWSGNTPAGGDHCVYYLDNDLPIHRSSHWQVADKKDEHYDRYPVDKLYRELKNKPAFLVPHIGGRRATLDFLTPEHQELVPVIEIASVHGRFEWFLHEAFDRGLTVGVVADSDDHTCRPGAAHPTHVNHNCRGGLTGIYAEALTREGIWNALKNRRCYATTGERIHLRVTAGDHLMGSVFQTSSPPEIQVEVVGTSPLEKVEIVREKETIYSHPLYRGVNPLQDTFKIMWGGQKPVNRNRYVVWDGSLTVEKGKFSAVEEVAFENPTQGIQSWNSRRIQWHSTTSGDTDGLIIQVGDAPANTRFHFHTSPLEFSFSMVELMEKDLLKKAGEIEQQVTVSKMPRERGPLRVAFSHTDLRHKQGLNRYYVRVTQENGEMAWSSPFYITFE